MDPVFSPWAWLAGSLALIIGGFVAASGWPRRRPRTSGRTLTFERKRIGL